MGGCQVHTVSNSYLWSSLVIFCPRCAVTCLSRAVARAMAHPSHRTARPKERPLMADGESWPSRAAAAVLWPNAR
jgi:hypothetical protein